EPARSARRVLQAGRRRGRLRAAGAGEAALRRRRRGAGPCGRGGARRGRGGRAPAFERQALVRLRSVAGEEALGRAAERVRDAFVWSGAPWDREASRRLRERQARELVPRGRLNVQLTRGGTGA